MKHVTDFIWQPGIYYNQKSNEIWRLSARGLSTSANGIPVAIFLIEFSSTEREVGAVLDKDMIYLGEL